MRKITFVITFFALAISAFAQTDNPVLMEVNGKKITKAEFEYSYNKNNSVEGAVEQKSVEEYVQMYVDYKLKVAEAEALSAKLATMTLEFKVNSKNGVVFNSVSTKQIQEALRQKGITIDKRKIIDNQPITSLGYSNIKSELYKGVIGTIKVLLKE